jgi:hypothetical protein
MTRFFSAFVLVSAIAGTACGNASGENDDPPIDAQVPDAQPSAPDAQAAPDAGPPPDASPPCVEGDAQRQNPETGACYMLFTDRVSWIDARDACTSLSPGTRLITLTTLEEHELLVDMSMGFNVWLGATDAAQEGEFLWVTGEPVTFAVWDEGEPSNDNGSGVPENCVILINAGTRAGTWDDRGCGNLNSYACKRL